MSKEFIYYINIGSETVMALVMLFVIFSCSIRKNRFATRKPLIILAFAILQLLVCQVSEWFFMIAGNNKIGAPPSLYQMKSISYTLDYFMYFIAAIAFFNYISLHIKDIQNTISGDDKSDSHYFVRNTWLKILVVYGIVITVVFAYLLKQSWFYYVDEKGKELFNYKAYGAMYLLGTLGVLSCIFIIIKNKKILGTKNFVLLLVYSVSPISFVIFDLLYSTCVTYLLMAFFVFVLYIHIDLKSEEIFVQKELQLASREKELETLNTQIMLSQMQPHFLYNTLSSISSLCYIEGAMRAKNAVDKFSDYLRENLDSLGKEKYIPFKKELHHIDTYLWIEQMRFGDSLNVDYDINVTDFEVPSLLVQPIVENAVKHGLRKKEGGGTVKLKSFETDEEYQVIIEDDGAGYDIAKKLSDDRSHVGIQNIRSRLELLCKGSLEIKSEIGIGTTVIIHIPKNKEV